MTREVPLSRGLVALVDDADYDRVVGEGKWHARASLHTHYARRNVWVTRERCVTILMHAFITGWSLVDHINGDGLDNRRANMRPATPAQNQQNARGRSDNASGLKGVRRLPSGRWAAHIKAHGRRYHLGVFDTSLEAAMAYDVAAVEHFGAFARPNFPQEISA